MTHLDNNDIARMIDGTINKEERELFKKHLSECDRCLNIYSETKSFMEEENANARLINLQIFTFPRKLLAAAFLLMAVLVGIFILTRSPGGRINPETQQSLVKRYDPWEKEYSQGLLPYGEKDITAVRIGIFWEDLSMVLKEQGDNTLKANIQKLLTGHLKLFIDKTNPLMEAVTDAGTGNLETIETGIRQLMEKESLFELYLFGRFLERSFLATYEKKIPNRAEIVKYQRLAREYKFSIGVLRGLSMLETAAGIDESRSICNNIVEIFFD
jgi:hypothetical protein